METKPLLYGIIGFMLGGLLVSIAATTFEKEQPENTSTNMSMSEMTSSLEGKSGDEFDQEFITQMIVHHEGAINMARLAEANAKHQEIKDLSQAIISAQQDEIGKMQQWQREWNYPVSSPVHDDSH